MKLGAQKLRKIIREELLEATIGSYVEDISVVVDVSKTRHATQRQGRHGDNEYERITDEEIIATAEEATDDILRKILLNHMDVGDELVIRDRTYNLNLVCVLEPKSESEFKLTVITVMRKKNFKPKPGSKVVDIY